MNASNEMMGNRVLDKETDFSQFTGSSQRDCSNVATLLEQVDWRVAQNANRLLGRLSPYACEIGMSEVELRWGIGACASWQPAVTLHVRLGKVRFRIHLESLDLMFGGAPQLETLPDITLRVLVAQACDRVIETIERVSGETLVIENVEVSPDHDADGLAFTLDNQVSGRRVRGSMSGDGDSAPDAISLAAQLCSDWPRAAHVLGQLPLRCRFLVGHARLTCAELEGISEGDLLLIKRAALSAQGLGVAVAVVGSSRVWMRAHANGEGVQIMDDAGFDEEYADPIGLSPFVDAGPRPVFHTHNEDAAGPLADRSTHGGAGLLNEIELGLSFELGEQTLTLGELEAVGPGYIFRLAQPVADTEIGIRVNGRIVGSGQLVSLGDVLGVRVTRFLQS